MTLDPLSEPERIAFVADWHGSASWGVSAIEYAAEHGADVILHLGDFGYRFESRFLRALTAALNRADMPLLFIDGNHESYPTLLRYPIRGNGLRQLTDRIWHLPRGFRWDWAGRRFLALGGAHSVDRPWRTPQVSWWPQETITTAEAEHAIAGGVADVLLSHDCPDGVDIPGLRPDRFPAAEIRAADQHRRVLRAVVDEVRPLAVWHGHYHQAYERIVDFGWGPMSVRGLDCDGTSMAANVTVIDLADVVGRAA